MTSPFVDAPDIPVNSLILKIILKMLEERDLDAAKHAVSVILWGHFLDEEELPLERQATRYAIRESMIEGAIKLLSEGKVKEAKLFLEVVDQ